MHILRHLFRSGRYRPAVYLEIIWRERMSQRTGGSFDGDPRWRDYFRTKLRNCVLQGLVLEEVIGRTVWPADIHRGPVLQSRKQTLKRIHSAGVVHSDVDNVLGNVLVIRILDKPNEQRVVWIDFSQAEFRSDMDERSFTSKAYFKIRSWKWDFGIYGDLFSVVKDQLMLREGERN